MILSGSNFSNSVGALFFEKDGAIVLHYSPDIDQAEEESLVMASSFFQYALQQQDWMMEFLSSELLAPVPVENLSKSPRAHLRIIHGGLSSGSCETI